MAPTSVTNAKSVKDATELQDKKGQAASARDKRNKTLQIPSFTLLVTAAMTAAKEACAAKVDAIVEECLANNRRFRDSKFDLLNELDRCVLKSTLSENTYAGLDGIKRMGEIICNPALFKDGVHSDDIQSNG